MVRKNIFIVILNDFIDHIISVSQKVTFLKINYLKIQYIVL